MTASGHILVGFTVHIYQDSKLLASVVYFAYRKFPSSRQAYYRGSPDNTDFWEYRVGRNRINRGQF